MKHRKHALRKAVTAAVLAGTAFSSFGGVLGTVTSYAKEKDSELIKKELDNLQEFVVKKVAEKKVAEYGLNGKEEKIEERILEETKKFLETLSADTLGELVSHMDNGRFGYPYEKLHTYSSVFGTYRNNDKNDWKQNSLSLISLIIKEIENRVNQNENRKKELLEKTAEVEQLKGRETDLEKEKSKLEDLAREAKIKSQQQEKDLKSAQDQLEAYAESTENLSKQILDQDEENTGLKEELKKTKAESEAKLASLEERLEEATLEFENARQEYDKLLAEEESRKQELMKENEDLKENLATAETFFNEARVKLEAAEKAKADLASELEKAKADLAEVEAKLAEADKVKVELEAKVATLTEELEEAKVEAEKLEAKVEVLAKELAEVKAEKEALQAEIDKLKEEHQKEIDALNAILAEKDKLIKGLEEEVAKAKEEAEKNAQMSAEEKAKLQKELDQAKKDLADMLNKMPNKVEPHTGGTAQAGQNNAAANNNAEHLPSTGEKAVNPLLVASGLSLIIGAGAYTYAAKRKKN